MPAWQTIALPAVSFLSESDENSLSCVEHLQQINWLDGVFLSTVGSSCLQQLSRDPTQRLATS